MGNYSFQVSEKDELDKRLKKLAEDPAFNFSGWIKAILRQELKI